MIDSKITIKEIQSWLKNNACPYANIAEMIIEQLVNGETTVEELREWILEGRKYIN